MKYLKSVLRITILLAVALLCIFVYFKPDDIANGEVVTQGLTQDFMSFVEFHQKPNPPTGINQDWNNYVAIFFYLLVSIDLYRKNSYLKLVTVKMGELQQFEGMKSSDSMKYFSPLVLYSSIIIVLIAIYSFFQYLPDIFTYVESTKFIKSSVSSNRNINVWSSGWSVVLRELSSIIFYSGIIRLVLKLKAESKKRPLSGPAD